MARRCSHCSHNGHNLRTCPSRGGVKLFGVRLDGSGPIRKSASMGNLLSHHHTAAANPAAGASPAQADDVADDRDKDGYASEGFVKGSGSCCRKKGVAWTEEEHKRFLLGLQKLGKGDWRGISRSYVLTRTPTQVASHAQKYFIRHTNANRRKRRSSLFDMAPDELGDGQQEPEGESSNPPGEHEPAHSNSGILAPEPIDVVTAIPKPENVQYPYPVMCAPYPPFFPFSYPMWPCFGVEAKEGKAHEVVKPIAVHSKAPINVDELVVMSKLSLREASSSSLNLIGGSERHSAFHSNNSQGTSGSSFNPIHAI